MATFANQVKTPDKKMQDILLKTWLLLMSLFSWLFVGIVFLHTFIVVVVLPSV